MTWINQPFFTQLGVVPPAARGADAYNRIEEQAYERRTEQADEGLATARLPVPLYIMAAAALFG